MRRIQIERRLFELLGLRFLVFENFEDSDLNIDDKTIYKYDDQDVIVDIFVVNKFYSIWNDERRYKAGIICACDGKLSKVIELVKSCGITSDSYSTFDCNLGGEDRVLFLTSPKAMHVFISHLSSLPTSSRSVFFNTSTYPQRKNRVPQT